MLSCECDYGDPGDYDWFCYYPKDFTVLDTSRRKRCSSCKKLIDIGATVVRFDRFRQPIDDIEERIKGDEVPLASWYMCEACGEQFLNLTAIGYCPQIDENMFDLLAEYHKLTGFTPPDKA